MGVGLHTAQSGGEGLEVRRLRGGSEGNGLESWPLPSVLTLVNMPGVCDDIVHHPEAFSTHYVTFTLKTDGNNLVSYVFSILNQNSFRTRVQFFLEEICQRPSSNLGNICPLGCFLQICQTKTKSPSKVLFEAMFVSDLVLDSFISESVLHWSLISSFGSLLFSNPRPGCFSVGRESRKISPRLPNSVASFYPVLSSL